MAARILGLARFQVGKISGPVAADLAVAGLDLFVAFDAAAYNLEVPQLAPLEMFGRDHALALVVGNTKALWLPFLSAYQASPKLQQSADPLNSYVETVIYTALGADLPRHIVRFAHQSGEKMVAIQQAAHIAGLASLGPANLAAHPTYGPWIGLRAIITFDHAPPPGGQPSAAAPCATCSAPCKPALDAALKVTKERSRAGMEAVWREWLKVRDACPVGTDYRYSNGQVRYHYLKDRKVLDCVR